MSHSKILLYYKMKEHKSKLSEENGYGGLSEENVKFVF